MAYGPDRRFSLKTDTFTPAEARAAEIDVGLRAYMLKVYNYMASGLALTGLVAAGIAQSEAAMQMIFGTPLVWVLFIGQLGLVFFLSARIHAMKASTAQALYWFYAALMGVTLSSIFIKYTGVSITRVFFITSATFAAMSLYGYTTKRDLSKFGSFLFMGLIGVVIASIVNIFLQSSAVHFVISAVGVLVFVGLTAYDTQAIKSIYLESDDRETHDRKAILGALQLYLDFLNIFILLLQFFGDRR